MSTEQPASNIALEESFRGAEAGDAQSLANFFKAFMEGPLFVPERHQIKHMANLAEYPNDFVSVLGIQFEEKAFVPVFSSAEALDNWAGDQLKFKVTTGSDLINRMPEDWWVTVNPGSEISKEISDWELNLLKREGLKAVEVIADELKSESGAIPYELTAALASEYPGLREDLTAAARALPEILRLFLLKEQLIDEEQNAELSLMIAAESAPISGSRRLELNQALNDAAGQQLIGQHHKIKILVQGEDVLHGILTHFEPFYTATTRNNSAGFLSALSSRFGFLRRR